MLYLDLQFKHRLLKDMLSAEEEVTKGEKDNIK